MDKLAIVTGQKYGFGLGPLKLDMSGICESGNCLANWGPAEAGKLWYAISSYQSPYPPSRGLLNMQLNRNFSKSPATVFGRLSSNAGDRLPWSVRSNIGGLGLIFGIELINTNPLSRMDGVPEVRPNRNTPDEVGFMGFVRIEF